VYNISIKRALTDGELRSLNECLKLMKDDLKELDKSLKNNIKELSKDELRALAKANSPSK